MDPASSSPGEEPAPPARLHVLDYRAVRHLTPLQRAGFMATGIWHMLGGIVLIMMGVLFGLASLGLVITGIVSLMRRAPLLTIGFLVLFTSLYTYAILLARRQKP